MRRAAAALLVLFACGGETVEDCHVYLPDGSCAEGPPPPPTVTRSSCDDIDCLAARSHEEVCEAYIEAIVDDPDIPFTPGNLACDPGVLEPRALDSALRAANFGRWLAGLPPVALDPALAERTQACARMMAVQGGLSHFPSPEWACYSEAGAKAASESNLAIGRLAGEPSVAENVVIFFEDYGGSNLDHAGHRRWLQSPRLGAVGYGLHVAGSNVGTCFNVTSNQAPSASGPTYIAYPNPGPMPLGILQRAGVPWSVAVDVPYEATWPAEGAIQVRVERLSEGGTTDVPIERVNVSTRWLGSTYAVVFVPRWGGLPGRYRVRIDGLPVHVDYETDIRRCTSSGG